MIDGNSMDRDEPGRTNRLDIPGVASTAEKALDLGQLGIGKPDFTQRTPTDANRRTSELDDTSRLGVSSADLEIRGVGHHSTIPFPRPVDLLIPVERRGRFRRRAIGCTSPLRR